MWSIIAFCSQQVVYTSGVIACCGFSVYSVFLASQHQMCSSECEWCITSCLESQGLIAITGESLLFYIVTGWCLLYSQRFRRSNRRTVCILSTQPNTESWLQQPLESTTQRRTKIFNSLKIRTPSEVLISYTFIPGLQKQHSRVKDTTCRGQGRSRSESSHW